MAESVKDAGTLLGQRVAFTGKLATMSRAQAVRMVRDCGGIWSPSVNRRTTILVIGQEGWPLREDGRISQKLERAKALTSVTILRETTFFEQAGIDTVVDPTRHISLARLSSLLKVPGQKIRQWIEWGLIEPCETVRDIHYFDFRQVSWAKTLCEFLEQGISVERLRRSIKQLCQWLPEADESLAKLSLLEKEGRLLVRLQDQLIEPCGQRTLDFGDEENTTLTVPLATGPQTAAEWFALGYQKEVADEFAEAERAYRQALQMGGPDPQTCFNLANVLYAQGKKTSAVERYWQVVELDRTRADAWNNLGKVLEELRDPENAIAAYEEALRADAHALEARFNLADLLDELGRSEAARQHWQIYIRQDQIGPWADYARRRLA